MKITIHQMDSAAKKAYLEIGYSEHAAAVFHRRGVDPETATLLKNNPKKLFLSPKHLPCIADVSEQIITFLQKNNREIWIFADYDVDGITSGYVLTDFLRKLEHKNDVFVYFPERAEGYGLSMDFCERLIQRKEETEKEILLITVDNGVTQIGEIEYLQENDIPCIVTDHHMPKSILPSCFVVDPHVEEKNPLKHLAGCGVAYKLAEYINNDLGNPVNMDQYLFAVAIGTVADIMPMHIENMAFAAAGLKQIKKGDYPHGFKAFLEKLDLGKKITPIDISFEIAPRLNACGRMGDINAGSMLFFLSDQDEIESINAIINDIEDLNNQRKSYTQKLKNELLTHSPKTTYIVMYDISEYPDGIAAIAAGRISDQFGTPSIAYSNREGVCRGSVRSIEGINILPFLEDAHDEGLVLEFGGHEAAAGISFDVKCKTALENFLDKRIGEEIRKVLEERPDKGIISEITVDGAMNFSDIKKTVYEEISGLPYDRGAVFPEAQFVFPQLRIVSYKNSKNNPDNICFTLEDKDNKKAEVWAWGFGQKYIDLDKPEYITLIGNITKDFMRNNSYTVRVNDIFPEEEPKIESAPKKKTLLKKKKTKLLQI